MSETVLDVSMPWYRTLNRDQWRVLLASNLGWLFDGFEIYALFLTVGFALHQLLEASQYAQIPRYAGYILATTVFGWATGGVIGGVVAYYIGRKPTAMLYYAMCVILTPVVYLWTHTLGTLLIAVAIFGFFTGGIWAWAPIWLPELFPTRIRGTGVAFCYNAPRWIACIGPLIAGALIVGLGGYGPAATLVGLFFLVGIAVSPILPETKGKPLLDAV